MSASESTESKTLYPMGPTDNDAADNYMKSKTLEPNEQMAKIIKGDKTYVLTLKDFTISPISPINHSKETAEEAFRRRELNEQRELAQAKQATQVEPVKPIKKSNNYTTWDKSELEEEESRIKSRPKNASGALVNPNNASKLAKVRVALAKKGGTRKYLVSRAKKTRRHK